MPPRRCDAERHLRWARSACQTIVTRSVTYGGHAPRAIRDCDAERHLRGHAPRDRDAIVRGPRAPVTRSVTYGGAICDAERHLRGLLLCQLAFDCLDQLGIRRFRAGGKSVDQVAFAVDQELFKVPADVPFASGLGILAGQILVERVMRRRR